MQLESLSEAELEGLYDRATKLSGFVETCEGLGDAERNGWSRQVRPGVFDLHIGHGRYRSVPAMLLVGKGELVSENEHQLNGRYNIAARLNESMLSVHIPAYLRVEKVPGVSPYSFAIQEKCPSGHHFLPRFPASNSSQRRRIADLYWNTVDNFADVEANDFKLEMLMSRNSEALPEFFLGRLSRWLKAAEQAEVRCETKGEVQRLRASYLQDRETVERIVVEIKRTNLLDKQALAMRLFFKHFGHTDLVFDLQGRFFLPLWTMGMFPQFYGAACWVWNMLMHSYAKSPPEAVWETEKWREAFEARASHGLKASFYRGFYLNLVERAIAALVVDIPLGRKPFDRGGVNRKESGRCIFRAVLKKAWAVVKM